MTIRESFTVDTVAQDVLDTMNNALALPRRRSRVSKMPDGYSALWSVAQWKPTSVVVYDSEPDAYVDCGITPEALFDLFSTARSAPGATYYVATTGSDSNAGTAGAPFATPDKAFATGVAGGVPYKVVISGGVYYRPSAPTDLTVDVAIECLDRVLYGTFDNFPTPSADATYPNTFSAVLANVDNFYDRRDMDSYGTPKPLRLVSSADICNRTPGSWFYDTATNRWYVNPWDGLAPTPANYFLTRGAVPCPIAVRSTPINLFIGSSNGLGGLDMIGAGNYPAGISYSPTSLPAQMKAVILANGSCGLSGGRINDNCSGVGINNLHGLAVSFNWDCSAVSGDCFTSRRTGGFASKAHVGTVNCSGHRPGDLRTVLSCQFITSHNDCLVFDFTGIGRDTAGGTYRCIDDTKTWLVSPTACNDKGDRIARTAGGVYGTTEPSAFRCEGATAEMWIDGPIIDMRAGTAAFVVGATAKIHLRLAGPIRCRTAGAGVVDTY